MNKNFLFAALLCGATLFAQDDDDVHFAEESDVEVIKHEAKIGASLRSSQPSIELNYEYLFTENLTFGLYVSKGLKDFDSENNIFSENFSVMPYVRYYLGFDMETTDDGTYAEGFGRFMFGEDKRYDFDSQRYYTENSNKTALGGGIGKKYLLDSFVIDGLIGAGFILGNNETENNKGFLRINFLLGYRF